MTYSVTYKPEGSLFFRQYTIMNCASDEDAAWIGKKYCDDYPAEVANFDAVETLFLGTVTEEGEHELYSGRLRFLIKTDYEPLRSGTRSISSNHYPR